MPARREALAARIDLERGGVEPLVPDPDPVTASPSISASAAHEPPREDDSLALS